MLKPSLILCSRNLQWVLVQVFPRLRAWPIRDWPTLLGKANELESDPFERIGLIAGLVLVTWLLRPPDDMEASFLLLFFTQMVLAVPLLFVIAGPLYLRRIRRGLQEAYRQEHPSPEAPRPEGE